MISSLAEHKKRIQRLTCTGFMIMLLPVFGCTTGGRCGGLLDDIGSTTQRFPRTASIFIRPDIFDVTTLT